MDPAATDTIRQLVSPLQAVLPVLQEATASQPAAATVPTTSQPMAAAESTAEPGSDANSTYDVSELTDEIFSCGYTGKVSADRKSNIISTRVLLSSSNRVIESEVQLKWRLSPSAEQYTFLTSENKQL
ncbi:hypothetical protein KOW79_001859 [Hemibagrus wyckioides]|uniref:Uncharacterized protein n=1 Tax=Hemibagrus wyckioides TaxID=337641 RepID=A0A9D3P9D6_9TELE|nr:hypothetical protein KOW79_001859 [Hemibagrus wyckioides]